MDLAWTIFTDCTSEPSARKVATQLFERAQVLVPPLVISPYHKSGFTVGAVVAMPSCAWSDFVVRAISLAQSVADGWLLSGSITEELDAWSSSATVSGVTAIQICARQ